MKIIEDLKWRGLIKDATDLSAIEEKLNTPTTVYCGFDPTGPSLHVGHLVPLLMLRRFQLAGHHAIALAGGCTGMIGDPRATSERVLLSKETIDHNIVAIQRQLSSFLVFEGNHKARLVNNCEWLEGMAVIDFLRDYGKHFSVSYMLAKETVASRLETGISFTEFSYMILQSVDYLKLYEKYNCQLQIGGSDQWGNVTSGCELIRRIKGRETGVEALTVPLILNADGSKFGKSEGHAIWLDKNRTSPYQFYQYWINVADSMVEHYLKVFTFLSRAEIEATMAKHLEAPHLRFAQRTLASEMTRLVHGETELKQAIKITDVLFSGEIANLSYDEVEACFQGVTSVGVSEDLPLIEVLVLLTAAKSRREAREFIQNGSILVNGIRVQEPEFVIERAQAFGKKATIIRRGKKQYFVLRHQ